MKKSRLTSILRWLPVVLWMGLTFWLSSSSDLHGAAGLIDLHPPFDKVVHAGSFGLLALLFYLATRRPLLAVLLASLYGISDEFHQSFVPGRDPDLFDWGADTLGAALAVSAAFFMIHWRPKRFGKQIRNKLR